MENREDADQPISSSVLRGLESVVAPATALTALMYYFGLLHAFWFLRTFGVEYTVMNFTTYDFLTRSADGLFVPLAASAAIGLAALWTHRALAARISPGRRRSLLLISRHVTLGAGVILTAVAVVGIVNPALWYPFIGLPGLALSGGVLGIFIATRLYDRARSLRNPAQHSYATANRKQPRRTSAFWEWAAIFTLVNVGLFWAVGDYSAAVGSRRGADVVAALPTWPDVVVYSKRDLNVPDYDALETDCGNRESAYRYRYDGLKLILQSGDQYLFLPEHWRSDYGTAMVIPRTDEIRLDFANPGVVREGIC